MASVGYQIQKLSRPYAVFRDFLGPGKNAYFFKVFTESVVTLAIKNCFKAETPYWAIHTGHLQIYVAFTPLSTSRVAR